MRPSLVDLPAAGILAAVALDLAFGDPPRLPHPVRGIGWLIARGETVFQTGRSRADFARGAVLVVAVLAVVAVVVGSVLFVLAWIHPFAATVGGVVVAAWLLAWRGLADAGRAVGVALAPRSLGRARERLPALVGRDPETLDETEMARAAIESIAENASDGFVAPLFYLALAGPLGIALYKAINTLDSMIGHDDERHHAFGKVAARLDDLANLVPARLTAACFWLVAVGAGGERGARRAILADARRHASPNAGWPEAALAGLLDVRLGGPARYGGELVARATLHPAGREPAASDVRRAVQILHSTAVVATILVVGAEIAWGVWA